MKGLSKPAMPLGFGRKLPAILLTLVPKCAGANGLFPPGFLWHILDQLEASELSFISASEEWGMQN